MFDGYIIDAILQEEEQRRQEEARERPRIHIPLPRPPEMGDEVQRDEEADESADRGICIIPLSPGIPLRDDRDERGEGDAA